MLGSALFPKCRAVVRLLYAFEHETADANVRLFCVDFLRVENSLGIVLAELPSQFVTAFRNGTDAAPFAVTHFEDFIYQILCDTISVSLHNARVLIFHLVSASLELAHRHQHTLQNIKRFESCDDDGYFESRGDWLVFAVAHHGANVPWPEKTLYAVEWRLQNRRYRWRHKNV